MITIRKTLFPVGLFLATCSLGYSQLLMAWDFDGNVGDETSGSAIDPNVLVPGLSSAGSFVSRGSGVNPAADADRFNSDSWMNSSISEALANNDYISFTIAPEAGYELNIDTVNIKLQGSSTGPNEFYLFSSAFQGGFVEGDHYFTSSFAGIIGATTIFNSSFGLGGLTVPVEFRVYGVGATSNAGTFGFEGEGNDIAITGTLVPVPEPSTIGLLSFLAVTGILFFRSRRRPAR